MLVDAFDRDAQNKLPSQHRGSMAAMMSMKTVLNLETGRGRDVRHFAAVVLFTERASACQYRRIRLGQHGRPRRALGKEDEFREGATTPEGESAPTRLIETCVKKRLVQTICTLIGDCV
jgi:hypothetical protein